MAESDNHQRRDENVEAAAAAAGALIGSIAGPGGSVAGAWLGPKLKRWVSGVWAELSESARERQADVLFWAIREGVPVDEMEARIKASKQTELLTGLALDAASRTAWEDKVRTLGRSLAEGLLSEDNAKIDTEQMIIAAIADIEAPQLAMLDLLVAWRPGRNVAESLVSGPLDLPKDSHDRPFDDLWDIAWREWSRVQIAQQGRGGATRLSGAPRVNNPAALAPEPTWSPTELGEQVYLRFRVAETALEEVWTAGGESAVGRVILPVILGPDLSLCS